ncbi:uncharacterized protein LOC134280544 [Saccostrea cucullata]|uniref:uncharacterized protein LOC134280544 n=1 Tax=Saccostrea cuccullata TaxID=36930 RepID=UPI002ED0E032
MSKTNVTEQHYIECATCKNYSTFYCNTCHQRLCEQCRYVHLREKENRKHQKELIKIRDNILPQCIDEVNSQREVAEEAKKKIWKVRLAIKHSADEIKSIVDSILTENNAKLDIIETSILDEKIKEQKKLKDYISYLRLLLIEDYTSDLSSCQLTEIIRYNKKSKNIPLMKYLEIIEPGIPMFTNGRKIKEEIESIFGHIKPRAERLKVVETIKASIHQFNSKPYQKLSVVLSRSISKTRQFNLSGLKAVIHLSSAVRSSRFWASDDIWESHSI